MNARIKAGWLKNLRSGLFKQGTDYLRQGKGNKARYCCLGVLTTMAVKNSVCPAKISYTVDETLAPDVFKWAELPDCNPNIIDEYGNYTNLAELNDGGLSFKKIADLIEKQL